MMVSDNSTFIPTRGSNLKKNPENNFKSIIFVTGKPKTNEKCTNQQHQQLTKSNNSKLDSNSLNIKKVKHEIIKFGMSGFDSQKKEEAKIQLAIKLGAKPPKKKYKNYKVLLEEKKKEKEEEKKKLDFQQLGKNNVGKCTAKGKRFDRNNKKKQKGILDVYGKVKMKE